MRGGSLEQLADEVGVRHQQQPPQPPLHCRDLLTSHAKSTPGVNSNPGVASPGFRLVTIPGKTERMVSGTNENSFDPKHEIGPQHPLPLLSILDFLHLWLAPPPV